MGLAQDIGFWAVFGGVGFWVWKHQYLSHASSNLCAWSRSHHNHKTTPFSLTRYLTVIDIALDMYVCACVRVCLFHVPEGRSPLRLLGGRAESPTFAPQCQILFSPCALVWQMFFALWLLSRRLGHANAVALSCCHRWQHHVTKFHMLYIAMMGLRLWNWQLTADCNVCATLSSPNIQRLCSSPPEIQTCFVGSLLSS